MKLDRLADWRRFSAQQELHITQYTVPQYQHPDGMTDQVGAWDSATCIENMRRYINRAGKGLRGPVEELRDLLKLAHYAQLAYDKRKQELEHGDVYQDMNPLNGVLGEK